MILTIGTTFSTPFETGCTVTVPPCDYSSNYPGRKNLAFLALDSEGVECEYIESMVI